jgi:type II secretory pathway component PulM
VPLELIEMVKAGGAILAPVFLYLWWYEREERRTAQEKNELLSERTVTAMVEFKALLQTVVDIFNGRKI